MDALLDFIEGIADMISSLFGFVMDLISNTLYVISITAKAVAAIPSYFVWLPPPIVTLIVTIFGVVVIYKILGREG